MSDEAKLQTQMDRHSHRESKDNPKGHTQNTKKLYKNHVGTDLDFLWFGCKERSVLGLLFPSLFLFLLNTGFNDKLIILSTEKFSLCHQQFRECCKI